MRIGLEHNRSVAFFVAIIELGGAYILQSRLSLTKLWLDAATPFSAGLHFFSQSSVAATTRNVAQFAWRSRNSLDQACTLGIVCQLDTAFTVAVRSFKLTPQVGMLASSAAASCCCDSASALPLALSAVPAVAGAAAAIEARPSHHKKFIVPRDRWLPCGPPKRRGFPVWRRCSGLHMNFYEGQSH